ncbi:hypothetical protein BST81_22140 [Leptolyngbya sp. 'hensonii']|nr:hypothetical protein BST81_22140 [Leptolyngbya sp. 'hensonii']
MYALNPDNLAQTLFIGENLQSLTGYTPEEVHNHYQWLSACVHPDDFSHVAQKVRQWVKSGARGSFNHQYRFRRADGTWIWVDDHLTAVRDPSGAMTELVGAFTNVTSQVESDRRLEQISRNVPGVIYQYRLRPDGSSHFPYASNGMREIYGVSPEEVRENASAVFDRLHPDDLEQVRQSILESAEHLTIWQCEYRVRFADGHTLWVEGHATPQKESDGSILWHGYIGNITPRKSAEAALIQQSEREHLISEITYRMRQSLDLKVILNTTVIEVQRALQIDRLLVYRIWPDGTGNAIAEAVTPNLAKILDCIFPPEVFPADCYQAYIEGRIYQLEDATIGNIPECLTEFLQGLGVQAKLVLPIVQDKTLWGLLIAHHQTPRHWPTWEVDLLKQISSQMAIAIQQSELYQQVQHLNANLEAQVQERTAQLQQSLEFEALLKRITDKVRDSLDEAQILQTAVQELARGLAVECCDTGIYNADQTTSTIAYEFTQTLAPIQGQTLILAESIHSEVYQHLFRGEFCQFCDVGLNLLRQDKLLLTVLACPIIDDQGVLGDLWLFKRQEDVFNDQEVRLVQQVANQCAIALRQSRLYQASQSQVQELERLHHLKDDFLSTVSHELRSPMSNIKMALQMLEVLLGVIDTQKRVPPQGEAIFRQANFAKAVQYFQILDKECQREISLINDLLDLARLDAGTTNLFLTEVTLQSWIPQIASGFMERTRQQQQQLILQVPKHLPRLTTDLSSLERILVELLHNACKYTPAGETIQITARVVSESGISGTPPSPLSSPSTYFQLTVSNSGVEIPDQERDRIFDKFYRIPHKDPWKHGGTGLGLALVKKLVERLQGKIEVHSQTGQTHFMVLLPPTLTQ